MSNDAVKNAILIAGPTASGKSALALHMAKMSGGFIINTDSMQVYDVLDLLSARPQIDDLTQAEHYLYGHVPPSVAYSTGKWLSDVKALLEKPELNGRVPVFVGGTGLYFRALLGGLSEMPQISAEVRDYWRERMANEGPEALHVILHERDAGIALTLKPTDSQRIVRALEVLDETGKSLSEWQQGKGEALVDTETARKMVLLPDRPWLSERIARRFALMWDNGAIEEVKSLNALKLDPSLPSTKAIGIREISAYLEGGLTREEAIELAVIATRQYAKRQSTWFRNQTDDSWKIYSSTEEALKE